MDDTYNGSIYLDNTKLNYIVNNNIILTFIGKYKSIYDDILTKFKNKSKTKLFFWK